MIAKVIAPKMMRRAMLALLLGTAAPAMAAGEDAVLLASTGADLAPGAVVSAADRLRLQPGASVTLLFRSGQMLRLRGPLDASVEQVAEGGGGGSAAALAQAFRLRGVDASVIGGSRAVGAAQRKAAQDVMVRPERAGVWCVGAGDSVWLARPAPGGGLYLLRHRGNLRGIEFPEGVARVEWPSDVPLVPGERFELLRDGAMVASFTFHAMPAASNEPAAVAQGILLGCREQYAAALAQLAQSVSTAEAGR